MDKQYIVSFVGMGEHQARKQAMENNMDVRIGGRDGEDYELPGKDRDNRITLWVTNGKVVDAKFC